MQQAVKSTLQALGCSLVLVANAVKMQFGVVEENWLKMSAAYCDAGHLFVHLLFGSSSGKYTILYDSSSGFLIHFILFYFFLHLTKILMCPLLGVGKRKD